VVIQALAIRRAAADAHIWACKFSTDYNGSMRFEWERKKAERNVRKHGVSFEEAITAFYELWKIQIIQLKNFDSLLLAVLHSITCSSSHT